MSIVKVIVLIVNRLSKILRRLRWKKFINRPTNIIDPLSLLHLIKVLAPHCFNVMTHHHSDHLFQRFGVHFCLRLKYTVIIRNDSILIYLILVKQILRLDSHALRPCMRVPNNLCKWVKTSKHLRIKIARVISNFIQKKIIISVVISFTM